MTPGFLASSSLMLKTIFMRSEPMSAIFVKMPPQILRTLAPSDSPMAKPTKQAPALSGFTKRNMESIMISSTLTRRRPMLIPDWRGIE